MTRKELEFLTKLISHIKPQDEQTAKALAYINKDIAQYDARRGQLRDSYEPDYSHMW